MVHNALGGGTKALAVIDGLTDEGGSPLSASLPIQSVEFLPPSRFSSVVEPPESLGYRMTNCLVTVARDGGRSHEVSLGKTVEASAGGGPVFVQFSG